MAVPTLAAVEAAEETLAFIKAHPEHHQQSTFGDIRRQLVPDWDEYHAQRAKLIRQGITGVEAAIDCGTAACFAGWYAIITGHRLRATDSGFRVYVELEDGTERLVGEWASEALGLPDFYNWPGGHMFDSGVDVEGLERWVARLRDCYERDLDIAEELRSELREFDWDPEVSA